MSEESGAAFLIDEAEFREWLRAVDDELRERIGWTTSDLVFDVPRVYFEGWFAQGYTSDEAAELALEEVGLA